MTMSVSGSALKVQRAQAPHYCCHIWSAGQVYDGLIYELTLTVMDNRPQRGWRQSMTCVSMHGPSRNDLLSTLVVSQARPLWEVQATTCTLESIRSLPGPYRSHCMDSYNYRVRIASSLPYYTPVHAASLQINNQMHKLNDNHSLINNYTLLLIVYGKGCNR